jgi:hypothetical protein
MRVLLRLALCNQQGLSEQAQSTALNMLLLLPILLLLHVLLCRAQRATTQHRSAAL